MKFGHMSSDLLAYGASNGTWVVCNVSDPPSVSKQLNGHSKDVTSWINWLLLMTTWIYSVMRPMRKRRQQKRGKLLKSQLRKESGKSSILLDVKPWDDETDMKKLEEAVRSIEMHGLFRGASKLVAVGYGIKKLQIMLTIVDDLVSVNTLIEEQLTLPPRDDWIQSCDIVAFNKI